MRRGETFNSRLRGSLAVRPGTSATADTHCTAPHRIFTESLLSCFSDQAREAVAAKSKRDVCPGEPKGPTRLILKEKILRRSSPTHVPSTTLTFPLPAGSSTLLADHPVPPSTQARPRQAPVTAQDARRHPPLLPAWHSVALLSRSEQTALDSRYTAQAVTHAPDSGVV